MLRFNSLLTNKTKIVEDWYFKHFGTRIRDWEIFNYIVLKIQDDDSNLPTVKEIEDVFCIISCPCEIEYDPETVINIKKECLRKKGCFYNCMQFLFVYEFYYLNKIIPTDEELQEIIQRYTEFTNDPEEFHQKDKVHVPVLNLDKLYPIVKDTYINENCSLCQEEIGSSSFYKIPPCNHMFHACAEKCLGTSTVINWLSKNNFCPNCKTKVQINLHD